MRPARQSEAGFTLIETLATLLLTGMVVSAMTTIAGQWLAGWSHGVSRLERVEARAVALDRLGLDIQSAIIAPAFGRAPSGSFVGSQRAMMFIHAPVDRGAAPGLEVARFYIDGDHRLVRARAPFDLARPLEVAALHDARPVLHEPVDLVFAYQDSLGRWTPDWSDLRLPAAARVTFRAPRESGLDDLTSVFAIHASAPAICSRARARAVCDALETGGGVALPDDGGPASLGTPGSESDQQ